MKRSIRFLFRKTLAAIPLAGPAPSADATTAYTTIATERAIETPSATRTMDKRHIASGGGSNPFVLGAPFPERGLGEAADILLGTAPKTKIRACRPACAVSRVMPLLLTSVLFSGLCTAQKDIQQQRQEILTAMLTGDRPQEASQQRWICFNGDEPSRVKEARAMGFDFTPDPLDSCLTALRRAAKDRTLAEPYRKLLAKTGGDAELSETLPKAIGASALNDKGKVAIGSGKAIVVTSAMAFDAGFTVAYTSAAPNKEADPEKLKSLAESCFAREKDAGTCFSVGYVYGAKAFSAR